MKRTQLRTMKAIAAAAMMTLTSIAAGVGYARAEVVGRIQVDQWTVEANATNGTFQNCTTSASYGNGAKVMFILTRQGNWGIGILNPGFNFTPGANGKIVYWVDENRPRGGDAKAMSEKMMLVQLADSTQLFEEIRGGSIMYFKVGNNTYQITLNGTGAALSALIGCARQYSAEARVTQ